jgi:hypothetical protein
MAAISDDSRFVKLTKRLPPFAAAMGSSYDGIFRRRSG